MTTTNENEKKEISSVEILKSFKEAIMLARQKIQAGELKKAIEILEQLKECVEMENLIDMALDFARNNIGETDVEENKAEEDFSEEGLAKELLKLNPDAKILKGKRKPKKVPITKRLLDWVHKEER